MTPPEEFLALFLETAMGALTDILKRNGDWKKFEKKRRLWEHREETTLSHDKSILVE